MTDVVHVMSRLFGRLGMWGGGERYALELAQAMAELTATRLVVYGPERSRFRKGSLRITMLPIRAQHFDRGSPVSEMLPLALVDARTIHVHQVHTLVGAQCLAVGGMLRKPTFVTDLGESIRLPRGIGRMGLERFASGQLAVSEFARDVAGLPRMPAAVVYAGVNVERFYPDSGDRARQVVFVGRLMPHKGLDVLIRAMPPEVPLMIFGRPYSADYRKVLARLARGKTITFNEQADDVEVAEALRRSRVAVLPSVFRSDHGPTVEKPELFGLAAAEAMASGTPTIVTSVASLPEVVVNGRTGWVVPPNEIEPLRQRISELLDDSPRWRSMSREAVERVHERFTWPLVARACLEAYGTLRR